MEAAREMLKLAPIVVVNGVEYGDYPSDRWDKTAIEDAEVVEDTTEESDYSMNPYTLTRYDLEIIHDEFRQMIDKDFRGDIDGVHFTVPYKAYDIEAIHHYKTHEERGGDSYCGVWERVGVVDEDRIEVVKVIDENGNDYPEIVNLLNHYEKTSDL